MRDKNGTADTITLIDFDLTGYGFPAFDWSYFLYYSSQGSQIYFKTSKNTLTSLRRSLESWSYTSFHPGTTFLPAEEVDFFLQNYLIQAGLEETKSLEEIKLEFEIHLTYVLLCKSKNSVFTKKKT